MIHFVLMSGEDMAAEYAGDRTGTVTAIFTDKGEAEAALAEIEAAGTAQRAAYDAWRDLSYSENVVAMPPDEKQYVRVGAATIERTKRRNAWIEAHPPPPSNLMHHFWIVQIPPPAPPPHEAAAHKEK